MGYSEVRCWFCGVSFNISRARRADEPPEAGSLKSGFEWYNGKCKPEDGCFYVRMPWYGCQLEMDEEEEDKGNAGREKIERDYDDSSFIYESDDEEPYEYESDDDLVHGDADEIQDAAETTPPNNRHYHQWVEGIQNTGWLKEPIKPISHYREVIERGEEISWGLHEHLAGPGCMSEQMYSGHKISLEEMKFCTTYQCLVPKSQSWKPEPDDEEFELHGGYFLSGLGNDMPSRDENIPQVFPTRHLAEHIPAEDEIVAALDVRKAAMPFHPTCFEMYKHASRQKWGHVEIDGLARHYTASTVWRSHGDIEALIKCAEQWWIHHPGTEWLVANPVYVPLLRQIFQYAITEDVIIPNSPAFPLRDQTSINPSDPFNSLPAEILQMFLSYLPSKDIANLRLVSRKFTQLPVSLWYRLIREEMPWLWEVWTDEQPSFWTTKTMKELKALAVEKASFQVELRSYRSVIKEEMPEIYDDWVAAEPSFDEYKSVEKAAPVAMLPRNRTNWYELYRGITTNWEDLKGLRNRRWNWGYIEGLVEKIEVEGHIS